MGLFGRVDRTRALRDRRIRHLGEEVPVEARRRFLGVIPSLGAASVVAGTVVLGTVLLALGHWTNLGGARGCLVLLAGATLVGAVVTLGAAAFAPAAVLSGKEALRAGGLVLGTLALVRVMHGLGVPYLAPLPLAGAVATIVWGPGFALVLGAPLALGAGLTRGLEGASPFATGGVVHAVALGLGYATAVLMCRRVPGRGALIRAGFASGVVLGASVLVARALLFPTSFWATFPPPASYDIVWALLNGSLFGFILFELLPIVERLTGAITDIRLVELGDLNRPILKKMNLEAPGTFHHSQVVARLAEAAAEAIGANGLLARVGAYYHDLGKMAKPAYFTENNRESGKRHGALRPQLSALVIHAHVKDGLELARELGLPERVVAFIPEHHGTTACEYFYRQAAREAQARGETIDKEVFRYPGPRPQSKETGIVHIADSVEAVTRSLAEPTPARIQTVVHEVVMDKLLDHQFDECPLTLGDLTKVQASMVRTLTAIYHGRVKYPEKLEGTVGERRLQRLAKLRQKEAAAAPGPPPPGVVPEATPPAVAPPEAKAPEPGYEPPMTW